MESLIAYVFAQWPLGALALLTFVGFAVSPYGRLWQNDSDRKRVMGRLATHGWRLGYTRNMRPALDRIDAALSQDELARGLPSARVAWSHDLILWCLLCALGYPVLSITGHWLAGDPLTFAGVEVAPAGTAQARAYLAASLGGPAAIFLIGVLKSRWRWPLFMFATGILCAGLFFADRFGIPNAVAFTFAGAFTFAFAVAFAVASAVAMALQRYQSRKGRHSAFWACYALALLTALCLAILLSPAAQAGWTDAEDRYLVLFLGVFPLCNALADFASVGLTRHLLRKGLDHTTWRKALADLAGGAMIFALLAISLITFIHLVRFPDDTPLMNLTTLFDGLRDAPGDYWWLFFMLFSTLIPTVLHGMVGLYTLLLHYPEPLRRWVFTRLERGGTGSDTDGWWGSLGYCAMLTLSIWVPLLGTWILLTANHGALLKGLIWLFRQYAQAIGAI